MLLSFIKTALIGSERTVLIRVDFPQNRHTQHLSTARCSLCVLCRSSLHRNSALEVNNPFGQRGTLSPERGLWPCTVGKSRSFAFGSIVWMSNRAVPSATVSCRSVCRLFDSVVASHSHWIGTEIAGINKGLTLPWTEESLPLLTTN